MRLQLTPGTALHYDLFPFSLNLGVLKILFLPPVDSPIKYVEESYLLLSPFFSDARYFKLMAQRWKREGEEEDALRERLQQFLKE